MKTKSILKEKWRNHRYDKLTKAFTEKQNIVNEQNDKKLIDIFSKKNQSFSKIQNYGTPSPENFENFGIDSELHTNNFEVKQINLETLFSDNKVKQLKKQSDSQTKLDLTQSHLQGLICSSNIKNSPRYKAKSYIQNPYLMEKYLEDVKLPFINKDEHISFLTDYKPPKKENKKGSKTKKLSNKSAIHVVIDVPFLNQENKSTQSDLFQILPNISARNLSRFEDRNSPSPYKLNHNKSFNDYINQEEQSKNQKPLIRLKSILNDKIQRKHVSGLSYNHLHKINEKNSKINRMYSNYPPDLLYSDLLTKRNGSLTKVVSRTNHHMFRPKTDNENKFLEKMKMS